MVDDRARQGALRFTEREGGDFLASNERGPIPPFLELSALLSAAQDADADEETEEELQLLLTPGSSLGGARPKASVMDPKGRLAIAKFPKADDRIDVVRWEAVALALAREAHIVIPEWSLESASSRPVLVSRRFDRRGKIRIPYLSAVSMLETAERESHTYMDLADALTRHGAQPIEDKRELWRRMVFNMLISNTDNHLRNHGFVRQGQLGWRLAPAFDLNPVPAFLGPRVFATGLDGGDLSVARALDVAHYFQLDGSEARAAMGDVAQAVSLWRQIAKDLGVARTEIDRMRSAFEHADLKLAGVPS